MAYQGFTNAQTWCVYNTLRNESEILEKALAARSVDRLMRLVFTEFYYLCRAFAPWAWENGETMDCVNFTEIFEELHRL